MHFRRRDEERVGVEQPDVRRGRPAVRVELQQLHALPAADAAAEEEVREPRGVARLATRELP